MPRAPFLSVIIPAYNVEAYLTECLDSLFDGIAQLPQGTAEVIIVNDGSTDGTPSLLAEYKNNHLFRQIDQENAGQSAARNAGLRAASGEYVCFFDSDDYILPDALAKAISFLRENAAADIVEYDYTELDESSGSMREVKERPLLSEGGGQQLCASWIREGFFRPLVWTKIVRRRLLTENGLFFLEGITREDEEWCPKIFAYAAEAAYIPLSLYVYRKNRPGSTMYTKREKDYFDMIKVFDSLLEFSKREGLSSEYAAALREDASSIYFGVLAGAKADGKYNEKLIDELSERIGIVRYSGKFHRRFFYFRLLKVFGVKAFYFCKHGFKENLSARKNAMKKG